MGFTIWCPARQLCLWLHVATLCLAGWCGLTAADTFVTRSGTSFQRNGNSFHAAGANCYYVTYKSHAMVDAVLTDAVNMGLRVVRVWGFLDCGTGDPMASTPVLPTGEKDGVYFQYKDSNTNTVQINDGPDGLQRLDYVMAKAAQLGLTVEISLTNNWTDFGGMDQYVAWYGGSYHDEFYTNSAIVTGYLTYVNHLVNRTNTVNGRKYRDDPAIFAWELANEPRCTGSTGSLNRVGWTLSTITTWAGAASTYIKSIDPNHLVTVGDEGFFDRSGSPDWAYSGEGGVNHDALLALPNIDFGSFHLYPDNWTKTIAWGTQWIVDHCTAAATAGKPTVLGEYGYEVPLHLEAERMAAYTTWSDTFRNAGGDGLWVWMLAGFDPLGPGGRYEDYDHFTVYLDGSNWIPGQTPIDDDDVIAQQAWALHGLDNRPPVIHVSITPTTGPAGIDVVGSGVGSTDPDGQTLLYSWNFGDGTTATGISVHHVFNLRGSSTVTATVTDPYGRTDSASQVITILNQTPTLTATASATRGEAPLLVTFTASGSDADGDDLAYSWNFGDGTPGAVGSSTTHTFAIGPSTVVATVNDGHGGISSATIPMQVTPATFGTTGTGSTGTGTTTASATSTTDSDAGSKGGCGLGQGLAVLALGIASLRARRRVL